MQVTLGSLCKGRGKELERVFSFRAAWAREPEQLPLENTAFCFGSPPLFLKCFCFFGLYFLPVLLKMNSSGDEGKTEPSVPTTCALLLC